MKYWYKFYIGECPVCGADKSYKERVYGLKPVCPADRVVYLSATICYDWCDI
jgi:hypothetical protein